MSHTTKTGEQGWELERVGVIRTEVAVLGEGTRIHRPGVWLPECVASSVTLGNLQRRGPQGTSVAGLWEILGT